MQIGSFFGFSVIISASDDDCAGESEVCCPVQFTGTDGLYERHLAFDNVMEPAATSPRNSWNNATPRGIPASVRKSRPARWVWWNSRATCSSRAKRRRMSAAARNSWKTSLTNSSERHTWRAPQVIREPSAASFSAGVRWLPTTRQSLSVVRRRSAS